MSNWDLPDTIIAATQWSNRYTYFFSRNGDYYRFNDKTFSIDNGDPPYPRDTGKWWFGCGKDSKAVKKEEGLVSLFDEVGAEDLDVFAGDEDK